MSDTATKGIGIYVTKVELADAQVLRREPYLIGLVAAHRNSRQVSKLKTEPAKGITNSKPWVPDDPIEVLAPGTDVGDHAVAQIAVMESDKGFRRAGERLSDFRDALTGTRLGQRLLQAADIPSTGLATSLVSEAMGVAIGLLRRAGDDDLGTVTLTVKRGEDGSWEAGEKVVETEKCRVHFEVRKTAPKSSVAMGVDPGNRDSAEPADHLEPTKPDEPDQEIQESGESQTGDDTGHGLLGRGRKGKPKS